VPAVISYTDLLSALLGADKAFPRPLIGLLGWYERWIPRFFDKVTVISPALADEVLQGGAAPHKVTVSLDGADTALFKPAARSADLAQAKKTLGLKRGERLAFFHGTVEAHHGQAILASLAQKITAADPKIRVAVVAGGPGFEGLRKSLSGMPRVVVLPFQPPQVVARLAAAANAGMVPYPPSFGLDLVFTLKMLEYFSLGLPVVCFRLKSAQAVFGKSGYLLTAADEEEFVRQTVKATRMKPSPGLRRRILKDFSWDTVCRTICELLESTAGSR
jgi:glycosyltransferase involved in cell wall biosynthesis